MATKQWPSTLPEWATTGTKVEPTAAKKSSGWVGGGEKPPYQTFNWWQDNVYQNVEHIKSILFPYATLQEAIESATVDGSFPRIEPRYHQPTSYAPALERGSSINLGPIEEAGVPLRVSSDGRYVCAMTATDTVSVYNQSDRTLFATITLSAAVSGAVTLSSNGYQVAVGFDGKIERYDIATQALDWTYVHDTGGEQVRGMTLLSEGSVVFVGDAAATAGGSTPVNDNTVLVSPAGALVTSLAPGAPGDMIHMYWWNGLIAYVKDTATKEIGVVWFNPQTGTLDTVWEEGLIGWTAVYDIAMNTRGVVVVGNDTATTVKVEVWTVGGDTNGNGKSLASDTNFAPAPIIWTMNCECDEDRFLVTMDSNSGVTLSQILIYSFEGSSTDLVRVFDYQFDSTPIGVMSAISTDFETFYVLHNLGGGSDEEIYEYGLGVGPTWWTISNRIDAPVRQAAYPMRLR